MSRELGRVLRKGKIRVDARKAMAKLREHLLVDLHLYAVEVVRVAVLMGASRIDVTFDADDVILTFDGRPLDAAALPHLFEHLTGETGDDPARHLRLLALAVNAALGLEPAWVALTSAGPDGVARVSWTPALVAAIEREEKPLPEAEAVALPEDMLAVGTRFHLRRKVSWDVVRRAAVKTAPPEVTLLTEAARSLRVPLFVNGAAPAPPSRPRALARAAITLPGVRKAHVEIVAAPASAVHAELCELGVALSRTGFTFGSHFSMTDFRGVSPPVRVVIDADALPTNASRSAVREDAPFFGTLANAAAPALSDAIAGVVATLFGRGSVPEGVTVDGSDRDALHDALGAFLCAAEAPLGGEAELPGALRALLDVPLFRDGLGRPLSHAGIPREDPLLLWSGDAPVPAEMEPWADRIVWRRGRVAEQVFAARKVMDPERLIRLAKRAASRHGKLAATPAGPVAVPDETYLARDAFRFEDGPFAGLEGEVAIALEPTAHVRGLALRVFLNGRFFEAFPLPEEVVPLPCVIALQWPGQILPKFAYEGVEPSAGLHAALAFAVQRAVLLCERLAAERLGVGQPFDAERAAVLRAALATAVLAPERLLATPGFEMPGLAALPALVRAPLWPTSENGFVSLGAVAAYAAKTGAVCVATLSAEGRAFDGRPVLRLAANETAWLAKCLPPTVALVTYDAALRVASGASSGKKSPRHDFIASVESAATLHRAPIFQLGAPGLGYAVSLGTSELHLWHSGFEVSRIALDPLLGGVTIAVDDASIVPNAAWDGILHATDQTIAGRAERAFAEHVVDALRGHERARSQLFHALSAPQPVPYRWPDDLTALPPAVRSYLIDRAARGLAASADSGDRALAATIAALPLLRLIGDDGETAPATLDEVARLHPPPAPIPYLGTPPRFRPLRWRPLILTDSLTVEALSRWSEGRLGDASAELPAQERRAAREGEHARFRARPKVDPALTGDLGDEAGPSVFLRSAGRYSVAAALPRPGVESDEATAEVIFEERLVTTHTFTGLRLPVVARVAVSAHEALDGFDHLSSIGAATAEVRVAEAALALALKILEGAQQPGASHSLFGDARALHLVAALLARAPVDPRLDQALRHGALRWPTAQGDERPWNELRYVDGLLWASSVAFASWLPPKGAASDLDRPILLLAPGSEGVALATILANLRVAVRAVSDALITLQTKRSQGTSEKPRLAVRPAQPRLAQDLGALGVEGMEGEIALYESGESLADISALDGETRRVQLDLSFPVRAVARVEVLTTSAVPILTERLARAGARLLGELARDVDKLPPFVRTHVRALTCRAVSKGRSLPPAVKKAPVFPDLDGHWWALADLQLEAQADWSCTFDPPPYPKARQDGRTLMLTTAEHLQLHGKIKILNVTGGRRRARAPERRREAPPLARLTFDDGLRSQVLTSFEVQDGSLHGAVALLRPWAAGSRGIQVHTTHRPVCTIDDAPGWPLAAVVNDDTLHPARWFDQLLPQEESALRAHVRRLATRHLRDTLALRLPPAAEMAACLFLDEDVPVAEAYGSSAAMTVTGHVFLPATWPVMPTVHLLVQGFAAPEERAIPLASAPIQAGLPIGGALLVAHREVTFTAGAAARLALALRGVAERMLAPLLAKTPTDPELRAYAWNLRLLGGMTATGLHESAADGRAIAPEEVIAVLEQQGEIWLTDRQGSLDGAFPKKQAPPFILPASGSALVRVLRARYPRERLHMLGGGAVAVMAEEPVRRAGAPSDLMNSSVGAINAFKHLPSDQPTPGVIANDGAPAIATAPIGPPARSWFGALIDRVTSALAGAPEKDVPPTGLGEAVERALRALRLRSDAVVSVVEVTRGRLVRYHEGRRQLAINVAHPALARHLAAPSPAALRRVCIAMVAAALSEVNLALDHVTDQDEAQGLLELLRQEAAAGTSSET